MHLFLVLSSVAPLSGNGTPSVLWVRSSPLSVPALLARRWGEAEPDGARAEPGSGLGLVSAGKGLVAAGEAAEGAGEAPAEAATSASQLANRMRFESREENCVCFLFVLLTVCRVLLFG